MIEIVEPKDIQYILSKIDQINERTKRQTEQIKEIQRQLKGGNKEDANTETN